MRFIAETHGVPEMQNFTTAYMKEWKYTLTDDFLPRKYLPWQFSNFFIHFVIFEMSKRKIKQEVDLVLFFELFSIGKRKTQQSN